MGAGFCDLLDGSIRQTITFSQSPSQVSPTRGPVHLLCGELRRRPYRRADDVIISQGWASCAPPAMGEYRAKLSLKAREVLAMCSMASSLQNHDSDKYLFIINYPFCTH